jgi:PAS domain S-box-containing protein
MRDEAGAVASVMGIARDITELKQNEEQTRAIYTRLELAVRSAAMGIWDWDFQHDRLTWDKRIFELFGVDDPAGQDPGEIWLLRMHPADRVRIDAEVDRAIRGEQQFDSEFRVLWPDGSVKHVKSYAVVVRDADGVPVRVIGTNLDITARKEAELTLAQRSQDLARSNAELERFAYVASHDLQEPLRMITSYMQLLERRYKGQLDADADEFIAYAVDGANRMKALINDLLAFSRIGTRVKALTPTNFEHVLTRVCANLAIAIEETSATITHDPLPTTLADESQMTQLLQNLIGNAIKFRDSTPPVIHISAARTGQEWTFQVRDNGIGIAAEYFERIFVVFQRLHRTSEYPGTGIGLSICKKIIERHGGHIWVESTPGAGSTFYFTLPVVDA